MFKSNAAPSASTFNIFADYLHAGPIQGLDHFGQRLDHAPDIALARFHTLDGRQRYSRHFGELALIDAKQRPRGSQLDGCDQFRFPPVAGAQSELQNGQANAMISGLSFVKEAEFNLPQFAPPTSERPHCTQKRAPAWQGVERANKTMAAKMVQLDL
jgi:hypothetical protein